MNLFLTTDSTMQHLQKLPVHAREDANIIVMSSTQTGGSSAIHLAETLLVSEYYCTGLLGFTFHHPLPSKDTALHEMRRTKSALRGVESFPKWRNMLLGLLSWFKLAVSRRQLERFVRVQVGVQPLPLRGIRVRLSTGIATAQLVQSQCVGHQDVLLQLGPA